ncbi:hypothetical protein DB346_03775 [Verrucomicrobia bacterium LW23]|nr:hypothetical protein DB346_03775 [Verrucomicrobia bacterium LW23]
MREAILRPRSSKHKLTSVIRRVMDVPKAVVQHHRRPSDTAKDFYMTLRGNTYEDHTGREVPMHAGALWEWDDATINFPVVVDWPWGGDKCSERWGCRVGRFQLLLAVDAATLYCPAYSFVVRPHEAYRATDILGVMGQAYTDVGVPLVTGLEQGTWKAQSVQTALNAAGTKPFYAYSSNGKPFIENYFGRLWTPLSLFPGHVGRTRGSFEWNSKMLSRCQSGAVNPREHFMSLEEAMERLAAAIEWVNAEPIESKRRGHWIPAVRWQQELAERPMRPLSADQRWLFSPERRQWTARKAFVGGTVETPGGKVQMYFRHDDLWIHEGRRIDVHFDPYMPDAPARLILAEAWSEYRAGHVIGDTTAEAETPVFTLAADGFAGDARADANDARRRFNAAVRTEYRTTGLSHGRMVPRAAVSEMRTHDGQVARVERNTRRPAGAPASSPAAPRDTPAQAPRTPRAEPAAFETPARESSPAPTPSAAARDAEHERLQQMEDALRDSGTIVPDWAY